MNKPPDKYKCIKMPLTKVFPCQDDIDKLNYAIKRSNQINIKVCMLLKILLLQDYNILIHANNTLTSLPLVNTDIIGLIQKSILERANRGRRITDETKILFIERLRNIQNEIDDFSLVDGLNLSSILKYQEIEILTSIENNIKQHFLTEYINRLVNTVFQMKKSLNPDIKKDLKKVKNDLRNGTLNCDIKYHYWLNKYRNLVVPVDYEESYYYDIQKHPQKYLVHMFWINSVLNSYGTVKYQVIPQRTDIVCKHSQIDTKSIIELFVPGKTEFLNNLSENQDKIWNMVTSIKRRYNKNYTFDYCIITDGYACSIRYVEKTQHDKQLILKDKARIGRKMAQSEKDKKEKDEIKKNEKKDEIKKEKYIEFPYIEEIKPVDLLSMKNVNFVDPGKDRLFTVLKEDGDVFNYSNNKHIRYTKRNIHQKKILKIKNQLNIIPVETELSNFNGKSSSVEDFISYCSKKLEVNKRLESLYEQKPFRQYKWYNYICRERRNDKMLNQFEREIGKDGILVIGDASIGVSMRNYISTPNITLKRKLKERFTVLTIDEFRTSCINCYTHNKETNHFKYKDQKNKTRSLHSVLTYKMENNRLGCINRDLNAIKNIKSLYYHYLEYLKGNELEPRPKIFCREKRTDIQQSVLTPV